MKLGHLEQYKPSNCPFCGGEARVLNSITDVLVRCGVCKASILRNHRSNDDEPAIKKVLATWNKREG